MAKQIPSSPHNKKISDFYKNIKDGTLILQPEFQRKFVWTSAHKEAFIDTILKGLPFPEIYIAQSGIDIQKIETQEVVVDGQQRLSTLVQYIDELDSSKVFGKKVPTFGQLTSEEKKDFLNYNVVVRDLQDVPEAMIREIFKRINQTKFSLEQVEIHNAVYDGEFISTAKEVLVAVEADHIPIFSDSEMSRMSDLHFILLVMSTLEVGGYFSRDVEIEKNITANNEEYKNKDTIKNLIINVLGKIKTLDLPADSIWYRKSNFFTLVVELCKFDNNHFPLLKSKMIEFEKNVLSNKLTPKDTNDYAAYYSYMYTGTNSRQARVVRSDIFVKYVLCLTPEK